MTADGPAGEDLWHGQEVASELVANPGESKRDRAEGDVDEGARDVSVVESDPVDERVFIGLRLRAGHAKEGSSR
jgi:hypothetical protein